MNSFIQELQSRKVSAGQRHSNISSWRCWIRPVQKLLTLLRSVIFALTLNRLASTNWASTSRLFLPIIAGSGRSGSTPALNAQLYEDYSLLCFRHGASTERQATRASFLTFNTSWHDAWCWWLDVGGTGASRVGGTLADLVIQSARIIPVNRTLLVALCVPHTFSHALCPAVGPYLMSLSEVM